MQGENEVFSTVASVDQVSTSLRSRFPSTTIILPDNLKISSIREKLFSPKSVSLVDLSRQTGNSLRFLTNLSGKEIGGHIEIQDGLYSIASFSPGAENAVSSLASSHMYHTHTGKPGEIRKILEESEGHRDMPSDVDIITFGFNPNQQAEVIVGPYFNIIMEKQGERFSYFEAVHKILQTLQKTGPFYAEMEGLSGVMGENVTAMWVARSMLNKYFTDGSSFNRDTWLDFVRKCGMKVTIEQAEINRGVDDEELVQELHIAPGVYRATYDRDFEAWTRDRLLKGLEFLENKRVQLGKG